MNAGLLASADADGLTVFGIADRIGLRVFECNQGNQQVAFGLGRDVFVFRRDFLEAFLRQLDFVALLFKGDAEDLFFLEFFRLVVRVHLENQISALAFRLENLQRGF